ncbi:hypothetical protein [Nocardia carnea]|uniref:hypothetical protein n=1 Tax=Nocardia carnea TaxID=37328 RepID=UPI002453A1A5|nr:hypothetical protein [Nocardia carnea]
MYARARGPAACEVIPHADLGVLARQTVRYLDLDAAAVCSIALPLARADVIAMNFLPAVLMGARIRLVPGSRRSHRPDSAGPARQPTRFALAEVVPGPVENLVSWPCRW